MTFRELRRRSTLAVVGLVVGGAILASAAPVLAAPAVGEAGDTTDPTITFITPADGATYFLNQVVTADYSCADEVGGSGLATCDGGPEGVAVADGAAIDTSTVGSYGFNVFAVDGDGNSSIESHSYTVVDHQPDLRLRIAGTDQVVGNDVDSDTGVGQTLPAELGSGDSVTYVISVQNDAERADRFKVDGADSTAGLIVTYVTDGTNVTSQVEDGTYVTPPLGPGESQVVRMKVRATEAVSTETTSALLPVRGKAKKDGTAADTVRARIRLIR